MLLQCYRLKLLQILYDFSFLAYVNFLRDEEQNVLMKMMDIIIVFQPYNGKVLLPLVRSLCFALTS